MSRNSVALILDILIASPSAAHVGGLRIWQHLSKELDAQEPLHSLFRHTDDCVLHHHVLGEQKGCGVANGCKACQCCLQLRLNF